MQILNSVNKKIVQIIARYENENLVDNPKQ